MARKTRIVLKPLAWPPCPRCYAPMTSGVCESKGCATAARRPEKRRSVMADYSRHERSLMAKSGQAMRDGSFPIAGEADLHNAIRLAGNAHDPAAARAHIKRRAAKLGLSKLIPSGW